MPRPLQVDLWPFDLESGVRVTCDVDYLCANSSLPRPLCSRLRPDVRDRQTDVRRASSLNAPYPGAGHNNVWKGGLGLICWFSGCVSGQECISGFSAELRPSRKCDPRTTVLICATTGFGWIPRGADTEKNRLADKCLATYVTLRTRIHAISAPLNQMAMKTG